MPEHDLRTCDECDERRHSDLPGGLCIRCNAAEVAQRV